MFSSKFTIKSDKVPLENYIWKAPEMQVFCKRKIDRNPEEGYNKVSGQNQNRARLEEHTHESMSELPLNGAGYSE